MIGSYQLGDLMAFARPYYGVNKQTGQPRKLVIKPQIYVANFGDLLASTAYVQQVQIQANADFVLLAMAQDNSAGSAFAGTKILVTDNSSGENFTNGPVTFSNYLRQINASNGGVDHSLPYPRMLPGNSSLSVAVTTAAAETPQDLIISMIGVHVYALD